MVISSINAFLNGIPGAKHYLGYGMLGRAAFGLWGSYFVVMLNVFQSFVFYVRASGWENGWTLTNRRAHRCISVARDS